MLHGKVCSGMGGASRISEDTLRARSAAAGCTLVRGTLNIAVDNLDHAVSLLGAVYLETDHDNSNLGPLRWWPISLTLLGQDKQFPAFVVRHHNTRTGHLEIMGDKRFRDHGFDDGVEVLIERGAHTAA